MIRLPMKLTFDPHNSSSNMSITIRENRCCFDLDALDEFSDNVVKGSFRKELIFLRFIKQRFSVKLNKIKGIFKVL